MTAITTANLGGKKQKKGYEKEEKSKEGGSGGKNVKKRE